MLGDRGAHRVPVGDRGEHVVDHRRQLVAERVEHLRIGLAVDLEVQVRGHADARSCVEQRVEHEVEVVPAAHERRAHAVDQERGVVGDHVDDGVRRLPAVVLARRVARPARSGSPAGASRPEAQHRDDGAGHVVGGEDGEVVRLGRVEVAVDQARDRVGREPRRRRLDPGGGVGDPGVVHGTTLGSRAGTVRHSTARGMLAGTAPTESSHGRRRPDPRDHGVHAVPPRGSRCASTGCAPSAAASCARSTTARRGVVEVAEYEPKMNVTPNAVALKDD